MRKIIRRTSSSTGRRGRVLTTALLLGVSLGALSACDSLLEVELPAQLTDDALTSPASAETQINSIIANFECGYSAYAWQVMGNEDVMETVAGVASGVHRYFESAGTFSGGCDSDSEDNDWYDQLSAARAMGDDLYGNLQDEWTVEQVPQKERFSAIAAIYQAAVLDHFGQLFCEMAIDAGPLMTPDEVLAVADEKIDLALSAISAAGGDFAMPNGIASSAEDMAMGLRARILWSMGEDDGALAAAQAVPRGFVAYVSREAGPQRRNKVYDAATAVSFGGMLGENTWWSGNPNPVTGETWPSPIPFTGYLFLGIDPSDGRAVEADGTPVRWAEEERAFGEEPTPLGNGAIPDPRVVHFKKSIQGPEPREVPDKYQAEDDDIPFVNWKEAWLIRADIQGGQTAIDLVNEIRAADDLPLVTYADPGDAEEIRHMITEEWRRALWLEGRYYPYKIKNTDLLWFPRGQGALPFQGYSYEGAVRLLMPQDEFQLNENLTLDDRATGCPPGERPVF